MRLSNARALLGFGQTEPLSESSITKKFRRLAVRHHPNKGGDADFFKKISEAESVLKESLVTRENAEQINRRVMKQQLTAYRNAKKSVEANKNRLIRETSQDILKGAIDNFDRRMRDIITYGTSNEFQGIASNTNRSDLEAIYKRFEAIKGNVSKRLSTVIAEEQKAQARQDEIAKLLKQLSNMKNTLEKNAGKIKNAKSRGQANAAMTNFVTKIEAFLRIQKVLKNLKNKKHLEGNNLNRFRTIVKQAVKAQKKAQVNAQANAHANANMTNAQANAHANVNMTNATNKNSPNLAKADKLMAKYEKFLTPNSRNSAYLSTAPNNKTYRQQNFDRLVRELSKIINTYSMKDTQDRLVIKYGRESAILYLKKVKDVLRSFVNVASVYVARPEYTMLGNLVERAHFQLHSMNAPVIKI